MQQISLGLEPNQSQAGYRLHRLELLNWGTFNKDIKEIKPLGGALLLTGGNGSGKSTIVDALLTLLVPNLKRNYNLASGINKKDRTELSYVKGVYGKSKIDNEKAKDDCLRTNQDYSVLLGYFCRQETGEKVTLAQVFYVNKEKVEKIFVVARIELSIKSHFSDFNDTKEWKQNLRKQVEYLGDEFAEYSRQFRRFFGGLSPKALDLFNQTVSLKELEKLDTFVRESMLEKYDFEDRLDKLGSNFENIKKCRDELATARKQLELLQPLNARGDDYQKLEIQQSDLEQCQTVLPAYFDRLEAKFLEREITKKERKLEVLGEQREEVEERLRILREQESNLEADLRTNDIGRQISSLESEIKALEDSIIKKRRQANIYGRLVANLSLTDANNEEIFENNKEEALAIKVEWEKEKVVLHQKRDNLVAELKNLDSIITVLTDNLESLKTRKTKIPLDNVKVRDRILQALQIPEEESPFIGELIQVKDEESAWQGAIERLLHDFGLSLVVPDQHFQRFREYVNNNHLKGKIVFYEVNTNQPANPTVRLDKNAIFYKIDVKNSPFSIWLKNELINRYNFVCCDLENFYNYPYAITQQGLIKRGGKRNEKDDRTKIDQPKNYILGWSNQEKIKDLEVELQNYQSEHHLKAEQKVEIEHNINKIESAFKTVDKILEFTNFSDIDWGNEQKIKETRIAQKEELEKTSNLQQLKQQLAQLRQEMVPIRKEEERIIGDCEVTKSDLGKERKRLKKCQDAIAIATSNEVYESQIRRKLDADKIEINLDTLEDIKQKLKDSYHKELRTVNSKLSNLKSEIVSIMTRFKETYPHDSTEMDTTIDSLPQYLKIYQDTEKDGLPKVEKKFNAMVDEYAINDVADFSNQLDAKVGEIKDNIDQLNQYLETLVYSTERQTYIKLNYEKNRKEMKIKEFWTDLRNCFPDQAENRTKENALNNIGELLGKLNKDPSWKQRVMDVRNWLSFSVSEKSKEDHTEKDYLEGSSGKSGGQKAKFAYTILAAAIAYQYGLQNREIKPDSFRLVVVDEAFSKLDPDNAKYTMELFKRLNLQLLLVTPLDKIQIVEDYVQVISVVSNTDGNNSQVSDLSIESYKANKKQYDYS